MDFCISSLSPDKKLCKMSLGDNINRPILISEFLNDTVFFCFAYIYIHKVIPVI